MQLTHSGRALTPPFRAGLPAGDGQITTCVAGVLSAAGDGSGGTSRSAKPLGLLLAVRRSRIGDPGGGSGGGPPTVLAAAIVPPAAVPAAGSSFPVAPSPAPSALSPSHVRMFQYGTQVTEFCKIQHESDTKAGAHEGGGGSFLVSARAGSLPPTARAGRAAALWSWLVETPSAGGSKTSDIIHRDFRNGSHWSALV